VARHLDHGLSEVNPRDQVLCVQVGPHIAGSGETARHLAVASERNHRDRLQEVHR